MNEYALIDCERCGVRHFAVVQPGSAFVAFPPCIEAAHRAGDNGEVVDCVFRRTKTGWERADGWRSQ